MHDHGFGHFDLKLENILMLDDYFPVLHDFGFSMHKSIFKNFRYIVGSPVYRSPEIEFYGDYSF